MNIKPSHIMKKDNSIGINNELVNRFGDKLDKIVVFCVVIRSIKYRKMIYRRVWY